MRVAKVRFGGRTYTAAYDSYNEVWVSENDGRLGSRGVSPVEVIRDLVVIDVEPLPGDTAKGLARSLRDHSRWAGHGTDDCDLLRLADQIDPSNEPMKFGAIVEAQGGWKWARTGAASGARWRRSDGMCLPWSGLVNPKIVFEGVE